jgi:excisionase family DNA binding protein
MIVSNDDEDKQALRWMTLREVAEYTGYSAGFLSREAQARRLRAVAQGRGTERRHWRTTRAWVDEWMLRGGQP